MIKKQLKLIITFHTTADAMAMERLCARLEIPGRLIPAPRAVTADCGIAWCCDPSLRQRLLQAAEGTIEIAGCCEMMV